MADSPFKGLLYSPEVLGGIGLLTAGLSGQNPGAALPMLQQGMKTASMFQAMEEEEEKEDLLKNLDHLYQKKIKHFLKHILKFIYKINLKKREHQMLKKYIKMVIAKLLIFQKIHN